MTWIRTVPKPISFYEYCSIVFISNDKNVAQHKWVESHPAYPMLIDYIFGEILSLGNIQLSLELYLTHWDKSGLSPGFFSVWSLTSERRDQSISRWQLWFSTCRVSTNCMTVSKYTTCKYNVAVCRVAMCLILPLPFKNMNHFSLLFETSAQISLKIVVIEIDFLQYLILNVYV